MLNVFSLFDHPSYFPAYTLTNKKKGYNNSSFCAPTLYNIYSNKRRTSQIGKHGIMTALYSSLPK